MPSSSGPDIVQNGLVLSLDAADRNSYVSGSTTWYDLAGTNNGTLINGPTYNSQNGGSIVFDGVDDFCQIDGSGILNFGVADSFTIDIWLKINSVAPTPANTTALFVKNNCLGIDYLYNVTTPSIRAGIRNTPDGQYQVTATSDVSKWTNYTFTYRSNISNGITLYINAVDIVRRTTVGLSEFANPSINYRVAGPSALGGNTAFSNMELSITKIYNRALSASEIQQNYNAQKSRFGL